MKIAARRGRPWASGRRVRLAAVLAAMALGVTGCASETPLERVARELDPFPEYSVVLQDMRPEGFYHQYRIVAGSPDGESGEMVYQETVLDWLRVGRRTYNRYLSHLGMVILSKGPDGAVDQQQHPPGYQQVGDERYGRWRRGRQRPVVLGVLRAVRPAESSDRGLQPPHLPGRLGCVPGFPLPRPDLLRFWRCVRHERHGHAADKSRLFSPAAGTAGFKQPVVRRKGARPHVGRRPFRRQVA